MKLFVTGRALRVALAVMSVGLGASAQPTTGGSEVGVPSPLVQPALLSIGNQPVGSTSPPATVLLSNAGGGSLTLASAGSTNAQFAVTQSCGALASGQTCPISVTFTPTALGTRAGTLLLTTNGGLITVNLAGAGVPSQDFNANASAVVTGFYENILGRSPDATGLAFWIGEASRVSQLGADVREAFFAMAMSFFAGPEYVGRGTSNEQYIQDLYRTFFSRSADASGLAYWLAELEAIGSRSALLNSFLFSAEFSGTMSALFGSAAIRPEANLTMDLFRGVVGRLPDNDGYRFWLDQLRAAQCSSADAVNAKVTEVANLFFGATEYAQRARVDRDFVGDAYNTYLRRGPGGDASGFNFWVSEIGRRGRDGTRSLFVPSAEFQVRVTAIVNAGCFGGPSTGGVVNFAAAASSVTAGGTASIINVTRTGSSAGSAASVSYTCTASAGYTPGITPAGSGTLTFVGDETKAITVTPLSLPSGSNSATVTCSLSTPVSGTALGASTTHILTVTGSGGGGGLNCTPGPVEQFLDLASNDAQSKIDITLQNGQTATVAFKPGRFTFSRLKSLIYWSVHAPPPYDGWQASISLCPGAAYDAIPPGNEGGPNNCKVSDRSNEGVLDASTEAPFQAYECVLQRDKIYYLNVRWVNPLTGGPGCPSGICGMRNALNYR